MSTEIVADKYSTAIFELAEDQNILARLEEDFTYVLEVMDTQPQLQALLNHPVMENDGKIDLVKKIFSQDVHKIGMQFIYVMIQRGRARYIKSAIEAFISKARAARGILEADVVTTEPLSEQAQVSLVTKLQEMTGKKIVLKSHINPQIMGGLIVQIGDKRIDASVARRLEELEKILRKASTTEIGVNN